MRVCGQRRGSAPVPRVMGLLSLLWSLIAAAHMDPDGDTHPEVGVVDNRFVVTFYYVRPRKPPAELPATMCHVFDSAGHQIESRQPLPAVARTGRVKYECKTVSSFPLPARAPFLAAFPDEAEDMSPRRIHEPEGGVYFMADWFRPTGYALIEDGRLVSGGRALEGEIEICYDVDGSESAVVLLGHTPGAYVKWITESRVVIGGKTLLKWERRRERVFEDYPKLPCASSGWLTRSCSVEEFRRELWLFVLCPPDSTQVRRVVLGQPCTIYEFLVCSNIVEFGGCYLVAWVDLDQRLVLSRWDLARDELSSVVVEPKATWNTAISMARIGPSLLVAWHQGVGFYPQTESRIRTVCLDLSEDRDWSESDDTRNPQPRDGQER